MRGSRVIGRLPSLTEIEQLVDDLIEPANADREVKALAQLVLSVTNAESEDQFDLAQHAVRHAFKKTEAYEIAFEEAFRNFTGNQADGFITTADAIEIRTEA